MTNDIRRTVGQVVAVLSLVVGTGLQARAQERMPPIPPAAMTDAQKQAAVTFQAGRGQTPDQGPFLVLFRSPELMTRVLPVSEYLRTKGILPGKIRQIIITMAAREWTAQFEWAVQYQQSINAGVSKDIIDAIAGGRHPEPMAEDEAAIFDFCSELLRNRSVSDSTYSRAIAKFGEQGVVEAVSTMGYFSWLGMLLTTADTARPSNNAVPPLAPLVR